MTFLKARPLWWIASETFDLCGGIMSGHRHLSEGMWCTYSFLHSPSGALSQSCFFACRLCKFMKLYSAESGTVNFDNTLNNHLLWADMENKECALCFTLLLPWNINHQLTCTTYFSHSLQANNEFYDCCLIFSMAYDPSAHTIGLLRPVWLMLFFFKMGDFYEEYQWMI